MSAVAVGAALREAAGLFRDAGVAEPEADARLLMREAAGLDPLALAIGGARPLEGEALARWRGFVRRRIAGEPVGRILGRREFRGLSFTLAPETLEPRHDSEIVVEMGIAALEAAGSARPVILDLGCGTGCLLLSLLHERPGALGVGVDLSEGAARASLANAEALGLGRRALILCGDWSAALRGPFDLLISNPPYIATEVLGRLDREVRAHDPALALDGGADGLDAYRRIIPGLRNLLAPHGTAVLEIGYDQMEAVAALAAVAGARTRLGRDIGNRPRALALEWS